MITEIDNINLLEYAGIGAFIHQCNCFHTMGGGIALQVKTKYPELYEADKKSGARGDNRRLGSFSWARLHDGKVGYNLYSQYNFGGGTRFTNYEHLYNGLSKIEKHAIEQGVQNIGLPKNMGCTLGGGSWRVVKAIIDDIFENSSLTLHICQYQP